MTMSPLTLLLMVILLADATADLIVDESNKIDLLGDKTVKLNYEKEPEEIQISWHAVEECLELVEELGDVTSNILFVLYEHAVSYKVNV